jgi:hypothetical protein
MRFPGWERTWIARRVAGQIGWRLSQAIETPLAATFGVREHGGAQQLTLAIPQARGQDAPAAARLFMRNPALGAVREVSLSERVSYGLEAGLPPPSATSSVASSRALERLERGARQTVFIFPNNAFRELLALDPRETIEIRLTIGRVEQRLMVEVGDIGAARAFVAIP